MPEDGFGYLVLVDANHYKANCHIDQKEYEKAAINLEAILTYGTNDYATDAITTLVEIYEYNICDAE